MIQDYLGNSASRRPGHPAIILGNRSVSFADLKRMSESVCAYFRKEGLRRGDPVLILMDNGPEYAAVFFGIVSAGGVVVPLNVSNTSEAIRYAAADCSARHAVVAERALEHVTGWWNGAPIITDSEPTNGLRSIRNVIEFPSEGGRAVADRFPDDLALVLYTSGTTGKPKGIMLSHENLEANTRSILGYLPLSPSDRTLAILPFCYSYGNSLLLTHACSGATLVIENGFAFVNRALETMREHRVTGFSGVPSHYAILINRSRFLGLEWPHLNYLTCAGGGLPPIHIRALRDSLPNVAFHAMYGQTEGAARLSSLNPRLLDKKLGSIGRGIPGVDIRVVDGGMQDIRPGDIGEIVARGKNIMKGYLGDTKGTEEVLRGGWLHTGDLATVDDDGFIYIRGREKEFIKSGGYRIGPQQVEEVMLLYHPVQECAVVGIPDEILGERIVAFVIMRDGGDLASELESLTAFSREKLPGYMVPQAIYPIDEMPKTESGKVKRLELRDLATRFDERDRQPRKGMRKDARV